MQFKCFLFESLLLSAVEAGPLRKIPQFRPRQDGAPNNITTTAAQVQSQVSSVKSSETLTGSSVVTAGGKQVTAASLVGKESPTSSQDNTDPLVVVPITRESTAYTSPTSSAMVPVIGILPSFPPILPSPQSTSTADILTVIPVTESPARSSATHRASTVSRAESSVVSNSSLAPQITQSGSNPSAVGSQTIVISFTPSSSHQFSTVSATQRASNSQPPLTASGTQLTSTLSQDASSTVVIGASPTGGSVPPSTHSTTTLVISQASETASTIQTLSPAGGQSNTPSQAAESLTTLSSQTTSSSPMANPNGNSNIPTAIVASAPPATGTVSPATYASNLAQADALNAQFANLTSSSACSEGQYGCIDAEYAGCTSEGKWDITGCDAGEVCAVMPLNTTSGVQIGCFAKSKVESVFGDVPGQNSSAGTTSSAGNGNAGAVTVTIPSSTAYVTIPVSSDGGKSSTSSSSIGNGANAVTITVPSSTAYKTVTPMGDSSTTQSTSTKISEPEQVSVQPTPTTAGKSSATQSTSTNSPEPEQIHTDSPTTTEHHPGHTTPTMASTTPAGLFPAPAPSPSSSDDDPLVVIPVTRHSTTTAQAAPAPTEGNGRNAGGGTSTSTSIEGITTSIFITVTSISTLLERETVTVALATTTMSV